MERKQRIKDIAKQKMESVYTTFFFLKTFEGKDYKFFLNDKQVTKEEYESSLKNGNFLKWIENKTYEK